MYLAILGQVSFSTALSF